MRDLIGNAPLTASAEAAMRVADAVQHEPHKGARLLGLLAAALIAMEASRCNLHDVLGMARNAMNDAEGRRPEFRAVDAYIRNEILR